MTIRFRAKLPVPLRATGNDLLEPVTGGHITFRSLDLGSGAPLIAGYELRAFFVHRGGFVIPDPFYSRTR